MLLKNFNTSFRNLMNRTTNELKCPAITWAGRSTGDFYNIHDNSSYYLNATIRSLMEKNGNVNAKAFSYDGYDTNSSLNGGIVFGTGNAAPTENDYCFSGERITGLTTANLTFNSFADKSDDECVKFEAVVAITNSSDEDLVVGEIGLIDIVTAQRTSSDSSSKYKFAVLLERTALDVPITIPPGGIGRITYTVAIGNPIGSTSTGEVAT